MDVELKVPVFRIAYAKDVHQIEIKSLKKAFATRKSKKKRIEREHESENSQYTQTNRFKHSHGFTIDLDCILPQVENSLSTYEPHGIIIIYSVVQRASFRQAEEIVKYLWQNDVTKEKAVILVGNKADLARSRVIPTSEGKALAKSIDAKFIETSSGIQHNVDELLVGILKQVRDVQCTQYPIWYHSKHPRNYRICWRSLLIRIWRQYIAFFLRFSD